MGLFDLWNIEGLSVILSSGTVIPGGVISGNLVFKVTKPMTFRSVSLKVIGKEHAHVAIRRSNGKTSSTHHYYTRNNVHKEYITLLGGVKGTNFKGELPPGDYNFPFAFCIPSNAPPTIPSVAGPMCDSNLHWYVKAEVDIPFSFKDSNFVAPFIVCTAMPLSQYQTRHPFVSPVHRANRVSCCCVGRGVTTVQMNLSTNMLVFGRDQSLDGEITVNNQESKNDTHAVDIQLRRVCWLKAQSYERTPLVNIVTSTVPCGMKAGDAEKRFSFSLNLPNAPELVSCYRGYAMFYYYQLVAVCDGDVLFSVNLIASNALDESNRCPPINVEQPSARLILPRQYPAFVYAPPPNATPVLPQQPPGYIPQPTGNVRPYVYTVGSPVSYGTILPQPAFTL